MAISAIEVGQGGCHDPSATGRLWMRRRSGRDDTGTIAKGTVQSKKQIGESYQRSEIRGQ